MDQQISTKVNEIILRETKILPGASRISELLPQLLDKKLGLVVNQSSLIDQTHLVDTFYKLKLNISKIFVPEHGFRGDMDAGKEIKDGVDQKSGAPIISLYGTKKKPTSEDMKGLDYIIFDIQDVGVRFYTYISTLQYIMEACIEHKVALILLDRPNPNGHYVDGPVLDLKFKSFVGLYPIPVVYGMTIGELANMIKGEAWIKNSDQLNLKVIPCVNYEHTSRISLPVKPSPNLPNERSVLLYPSLCFFEGTVVSLGRGTSSPFQLYGHPDFTSADTSFTPKAWPGAQNPPHKDVECLGFSLLNQPMEDFYTLKRIDLSYLIKSYELLSRPESFFLPNNFFDKLAGTDQLRMHLINGLPETKIRKSWEPSINEFKKLRTKYLIYP